MKLMTHVVIGYPSLDDTIEIVKKMADCGVDMVELQIPFSDPLADGPTIMQANDYALANGVKLTDCFAVMKRLSNEVSVPLLFMGYYNTVLHYGTERFCAKAKSVGATALIIPDIPVDEEIHEGFMAACEKNHLFHIQLLSPSSSDDRIKINAKHQRGFVYCTSRVGTTGTDQQLAPELKSFLTRVKKYITVPIAVGFGITNSDQIHALTGYADIAVVGSALIQHFNQSGIVGVETYINQLQS